MLIRNEGVIAAAGVIVPALVPPVTTGLVGLWQMDGTGKLDSASFTYTGRLNDAATIAAIFGAEPPLLTTWHDMSGNGNNAARTGGGTNMVWTPSGAMTSPSFFANAVSVYAAAIEPGTGGSMYCVVKPTVNNENRGTLGAAQFSGSGPSIKLRSNADIWAMVQQASGQNTSAVAGAGAFAANDILRLGMAWDTANVVGSQNGTEFSNTHSRDTSAGSTLLRLFGDAEVLRGYATVFAYYSTTHDSGQRSSMMTWLLNYV